MTKLKTKAEAVRKSNRTPKVTNQIAGVDAIIESHNIKHHFDALPPVDDYHFVLNSVSRFVDKNTHEMKLYLGQNATRRTWAFLKYWPLSTNKGSQVVFVNEYPVGDSEIVKELSHMALMYPFRVFQEMSMGQSLRRLSHFVEYVFLYTGKVDKVYKESLNTVGEALIAAVGNINSTYQAKGGVQAIPDCHAPGPFDDATFDDDQIALQLTNSRPASLIVRVRVSPDSLASVLAKASSKSKTKAKAAPAPPAPRAPNPLGRAQDDEAQTVISEAMSNMGLGALTTVTEVIRNSKRKADSDETPFEHWKRLKLGKQREAKREKELKKQLKEIQARQARFDSEMEVAAKEQPIEIIIRWAAADVREESEEDEEVNPVLDAH